MEMLALENVNQNHLIELSNQELQETEGGFLPIVAVYACWGVMAVCSAAALGMRNAAKDNGADIW